MLGWRPIAAVYHWIGGGVSEEKKDCSESGGENHPRQGRTEATPISGEIGKNTGGEGSVDDKDHCLQLYDD